MAPKKGHHVKAKSGKHAGQVGQVHKDMGVVHVYQVHFPGYGLSYQPVANVAPVEPTGGPDAPISGADQSDFSIQQEADTGLHCVMKDGKKVKCHPTKEAAQVHMEMLMYGFESSNAWEIEMQYVVEAAKNPPNLAPYKIIQKGDKFAVVNNKGETKATFKTRAEALKYQRALYVNVPGAPGKAAKKPWSGDQKRAS